LEIPVVGGLGLAVNIARPSQISVKT